MPAGGPEAPALGGLGSAARLMEHGELAAWLRLTQTPGIGNTGARKLLAAFGLPEAIFAQPHATLRQVLGPTLAWALQSDPPGFTELLDATWRWLDEGQPAADGVGRAIVALGDPDYPQALLDIEDPPLLLYLLGQTGPREKPRDTPPDQAGDMVSPLASVAQRGIAIVGSRNPTPQGEAHARLFARAFCDRGLAVVSGLALGIDGAAHLGALDSAESDPDTAGPARLATLAVVGTGLDRVYPKRHLDLAHRIARHGLLVSEYPLGTPPVPSNFPRRNRLIAGLSLGTLVVEAALKSGSLITARLASEQGKDVFAIPGSIHTSQARGCHALIKQGAKLVESAQDVFDELQLPSSPAIKTTEIRASNDHVKPGNGQKSSENPLLDALGFDPVGLDALLARTGLDAAALQAQLLTLELDGEVARLPGGLYQRLGAA